MRLTIAMLFAALTCGCSAVPNPFAATKDLLRGSSGELSVRSESDPNVSLKGGFNGGMYHYDGRENVTILLYAGPIENPTQVVTIRMLWAPRAGRTPIDPTATNATVHYVIFGGEQGQAVGVYSGAGFLYPRSKLGGDSLRAELWQASISLSDRNRDFEDLLGRAIVEGAFSAKRDDVAVEDTLRRIDMMLHQRLGHPKMVMAK